MRTGPRLAALAATAILAVAGCASTTPSDASPSALDASPSAVEPSPTPSEAAPDEPSTSSPPAGSPLDSDAATQYVHAFCPARVLERSLELLLADPDANLGPARTTTAAAATDGAALMLADWVDWSDDTLDVRTRLATALQTYAEALLAADVTASALWPVVGDSPLGSADSTELRVAAGLHPQLDVACAGG